MRYFELTPAQKNIDSLQSFYGGSGISVICGAVLFRKKLDRERLCAAVKNVFEMHEVFGLRFCVKDGRTVQYISDAPLPDVGYISFSSESDMRVYGRKQASVPFSYGGAMYRAVVFDLPERSGVMLCASHLISDAWTYGILAEEVYEAYEKGSVSGGEMRRYTDFAEKCGRYLSSPKYAADLSYWSEKYSGGIDETAVRYVHGADSGIGADRYVTSLSRDLSQRLKGLCAGNGLSPAAVFESAVLMYLMRIGGHEDVTVGVPVLGRSGAAEKRTSGVYISTIPLTVRVCGQDTALDVMKKAAAAHREVFRHRRLPYEDIVRAVRETTGFTGRLFDVMVSFQNSVTDINAETVWFHNGCSEIPLAVHIDDRDGSGRYTLTLDYQRAVFADSAEVRMLAERLIHIIEGVTEDPAVTVDRLSVIPRGEHDMLVERINDTRADMPDCGGVHEAFSRRAAECPDSTAVIFHDESYSYSQLDGMSDALAGYLLEKGAGRGDILPIVSHRSVYVIIAMLAVMKAGAAYMLISPDIPAVRKGYMLKSTGAKLTLDGEMLESFDYTRPQSSICTETVHEDICYVIFTSGSTGRPKGTAVTHGNVLNYCAENRYNIYGRVISGGIKSIVSVTDTVFDIFVTETLLALLNGMTVILADDEQAVSQKALAQLTVKHRPEVIQTTPTKMRSFLFDRKNTGYLSSFKRIILGGEELSHELCTQLNALTDAEIYNVYGPAETTVWSTVARADSEDITVGTPVANTRVYILDSSMRLLPVGAEGEICIGGAGVSAGYITDPALTEERFVPDPFHGGRMYRTGDMGLVRTDGSIEFLGRRDGQIKLRGLRIELSEIESVMSAYEGVALTAAVCRTDRRGEQYLAGYYTCTEAVDEKALRGYLAEKLPAYMVPKKLVHLESMPMTASGKTDRKALPEPNGEDAVRSYSPPENAKEKQICGLMAAVLKLPRVGRDDDFFELGGDSFSALELSARAEEKGVMLSVKSIYEFRTPARLCSVTGGKKVRAAAKDMSRYPLARTEADRAAFKAFCGLTKLLYGFRVTGLENIRRGEKYIVCPNHESDLDCMWVWAALSGVANQDECCALIAFEHLDKPLPRRAFRINGGIPVERKGDFMSSLERAQQLILTDKRFLLIHPEGTRTRTGKLGKFRRGAAIVAKETGVKLIPVYICGAGRIYPVTSALPWVFDLSRMRRYRLSVHFGKPIDPKGLDANEVTERLLKAVAAMKARYDKR